jgi:hypothetical protein
MDRLSAVAVVVTVAPSVSPVHAAEDARKVSVVSFGLFGDQGVFRSEATGVAQVVADRFGSGPKPFSTASAHRDEFCRLRTGLLSKEEPT